MTSRLRQILEPRLRHQAGIEKYQTPVERDILAQWVRKVELSCGAIERSQYVFFSSPEHEVLMVSYCDQSMSVVRRASFVVNNLF